jgi:putative two-component system response regulator
VKEAVGVAVTEGELKETQTEGSTFASILVVDDERAALRNLSRLLRRNGYQCEIAGSADEARAALEKASFDLVLSDVNMPGDSGIDLLEGIARDHRETATVMVTAMDDRDLAERAIVIGAYGYIIKPYEPNEMLINVTNALRRRSLEIENRRHRERLESMVEERTSHLWQAVRSLEQTEEDLRFSREETIQRLSLAAELRDDETASHLQRMSRYCELLAKRIGQAPERCELIRAASVMHDIGKIGLPDDILLKPGKLTDDEYAKMQRHVEMGFRILDGARSELLQLAATIALFHHEKWNGTGYPNRVSGQDIPVEGRIAAIADVFDALTSNRVYRKAFHLGEAVDIMVADRGTHFDPELLDLFFDSMDEVVQIMDVRSR